MAVSRARRATSASRTWAAGGRRCVRATRSDGSSTPATTRRRPVRAAAPAPPPGVSSTQRLTRTPAAVATRKMPLPRSSIKPVAPAAVARSAPRRGAPAGPDRRRPARRRPRAAAAAAPTCRSRSAHAAGRPARPRRPRARGWRTPPPWPSAASGHAAWPGTRPRSSSYTSSASRSVRSRPLSLGVAQEPGDPRQRLELQRAAPPPAPGAGRRGRPARRPGRRTRSARRAGRRTRSAVEPRHARVRDGDPFADAGGAQLLPLLQGRQDHAGVEAGGRRGQRRQVLEQLALARAGERRAAAGRGLRNSSTSTIEGLPDASLPRRRQPRATLPGALIARAPWRAGGRPRRRCPATRGTWRRCGGRSRRRAS